MRTCLIFNPAAKGEKAKTLRRHLDAIEHECTLLQTTGPGAGRTLAAHAVLDGFETIIAAGGDGTLNEVLNGIGDAPDGFNRARLAVMPLGTVNVFGREIRMPFDPIAAWKIIRTGRERRIDLPVAEFNSSTGARERRYFAQMAGSGVDTQAIERVDWNLKKKIGPLAYVVAGVKAMGCAPHQLSVDNHAPNEKYVQILIGNGRYYGGNFSVFHDASLDDRKLDILMVTRFNWFTLFKTVCTLPFVQHHRLREVRHYQTERVTITSMDRASLELEGELVGELPATIWLEPGKLRVIIP